MDMFAYAAAVCTRKTSVSCTLSIQWGRGNPICSYLLNTSERKGGRTEKEKKKLVSAIIPDRWLYIPT